MSPAWTTTPSHVPDDPPHLQIAHLTRVVFAASLLAALATAQADQRPAFKFQRQDEDWSQFRAEFGKSAWLFDPFKHMALDDTGDWWVQFGGRAEMRTEFWDGFGFGATSPGNSDAFTLSRIHLHADAHFGEHVRVFIEGRTAQTTDRDLPGGERITDLDTLDAYNAFVELATPVSGDATLRLRTGRQSMAYGNQRLISPLPWVNALRAFEGFTALWKSGRWSVDAFLTALVDVDRFQPNERDEERQLYGVYATHAPANGGVGLDLYLIGVTRPDVNINGTAGDERSHTAGMRSWGPWAERGDFEFEGAYQFGEIGSEDISAWIATANVGYKPGDSSFAPRVYLGIDLASGDRSPGGSVQTFNQLYPLGHAYMGFADVLARQNIFGVNLGCSVKLASATTAALTAHTFQLMDRDDAVYAVNGAVARSGPFNSAHVGEELDLLVNHSVTKFLNVYGGYSHFFSGSVISEGAVDDDQQFLYFGAGFYF